VAAGSAAAGAASLLAASRENVDAFLKAVGKRFAALGLTTEQALEFNILQGLTKEQLAVLAESQNASLSGADAAAPQAAGDAAAATAAVEGAAAGGEPAAHDDDEIDKKLELLLEDDAKPVVPNTLDEATAAALLAMAQAADANFNAFGYGFFNDPATTTNGLLGELELDAGGLEGGLEDGEALEPQADLSTLADFDPVDLAQLASWGSIDASSAETAALAAALAAGALPVPVASSAPAAGDVVAAAAAAPEAAPAAADGEALEAEQPAGSEPAEGSSAAVESATAGLQGLSLGAGFE
jgi:hypothetical protein